MINNEIYSKIKKHYLYSKYNKIQPNKDNIYEIYLSCLIISFILTSLYFYLCATSSQYLDLDMEILLLSFFSCIYSFPLFIISIILIKIIGKFLKTEKILINKEQEKDIIYAKENMPEEHELLNKILVYIKEMSQIENVVDLNNNVNYKLLLQKIMTKNLESRKKCYNEKINNLKIWLETKIIEHNVSGYDIEKEVNNFFDTYKIKLIFFCEDNNWEKYKKLLNSEMMKDLYYLKKDNKLIEGYIKSFKRNFIESVVLKDDK